MRIKIKRKKLIVAISAVAVVALAGAALAYWTTGGSGSGSASAGTTTNNLVITGSTTDSFYPGRTIDMNVNVDNAANPFSVHVYQVSLVDPDGAGPRTPIETSDAQCDPSWFHFNGDGPDQPLTVDDTIAAGANGDYPATVTMDDPNVNQDHCKNATITFNFTSN